MGWVLRLAEIGPDAAAESIDLIEIHRSSGLADIANLGLTLSEAKELLARVQQAMVAAQAPGSRGSPAIVRVLLGRARVAVASSTSAAAAPMHRRCIDHQSHAKFRNFETG
jgi:hypothetical protein